MEARIGAACMCAVQRAVLVVVASSSLVLLVFCAGCATRYERVFNASLHPDPGDVPFLIRCLRDSDSRVRGSAARVLGDIGSRSKEMDHALLEALRNQALRDPNGSVREAAAGALGAVGSRAKGALPALLEALKDKESNVRLAAGGAIGRIGPSGKDILPIINEAVEGTGIARRANAVYLLGKIGPAEGVVTALCRALQDPDPRLGMEAAIALGSMGPSAKEAIPSLIEAAKAVEGRRVGTEYDVIRDRDNVIMSHAIPVYVTATGVRVNHILYTTGSDERGDLFEVLNEDGTRVGRDAYSSQDVAILAAAALRKVQGSLR